MAVVITCRTIIPCLIFKLSCRNSFGDRAPVETLQWRHDENDAVSNHRCLDCLRNRLLWCKSKKMSKLRVTGLCEGNSSVTGEFPAQRASNTENVSIWWRHHDLWVPDLYMSCWDLTICQGRYQGNSPGNAYRVTCAIFQKAPYLNDLNINLWLDAKEM